jgi:glycine/D-amino acid oxidase-like deaminating enzyme/nitrite reductase/ring-hydroxylating ferredoxin subunit
MRSTERSVSVWEAGRSPLRRDTLTGDVEAEMCVIGAGIAGITTAYLLSQAGRRVVVLDRGPIGGGETGQTTAHLSSALDDYYHVLERVHGPDGARLAYASHHAAIGEVERIVATERLACDFARLDGYWILGPDQDVSLLERERDAARRAGAKGLRMLKRVPGLGFDSGPSLRFPGQGQFHVLKYLEGLARAIERAGGRICTQTEVTSVDGGDSPVAAGNGFTVRADAIVVCTNPPFSHLVAIHSKQAPYRTFAIAARVPAGRVPRILLWDTADPYHYVRTQPIDDDPSHVHLIVGGEDVKQAHADDAGSRFARLEEWATERFPVEGTDYRWSGMVMEPFDYLAFIGRDPTLDNVYVATGDSGHGMTHGTIAGLLIRDLIEGRENPWADLYDPRRKTLSLTAAREYLVENLDVAGDLVAGRTDVSTADDLALGAGGLLRRGGRLIAAYRGEDGVVSERSARCTHLGCVVRWNSEERSWDCPCHGSRFAPNGDVLTGPARAPLPPAERG